jgi:phosphohistidine phosphatase
LKIIFLARHAKSSWKDTSLPDRDRPLKKRGEKDLALLKPALTSQKHKPEHIFSSDAKRAVETAKTLAGYYGLKKKSLTFTDELYASSAREVFNFIRNRNDNLHSMMIVGHNPEITEAAGLLSEKPFETIVPTSAVICFTFDLDGWNQLGENTGHMEFYEYPKKYRQEGPKSKNM